MDEEMKDLVSRLAKYLEKRSEQQLRCFHKPESQVQVEGWFKGEILYFLDQEKSAGKLPDFKPEEMLYVPVGDECKRINVDISLQFKSGSAWVELKHWHSYLTKKPKTYYGCDWYFTTANHSSCVKPAAEKLLTIREKGNKFMLVLCTDKPSSEGWNFGVKKFNDKFSPLSVCSLTNPGDYPEYFFLGLLRVSRGDQH